MRTGDLIFWTGDQFFEKKIASLWGYSHVSLVINFPSAEHEDHYVVEALAGGLKLRNLRHRLTSFDIWEAGYTNSGKAWSYEIDIEDDKKRRAIRSFALQELARDVKYDYLSFMDCLFGGEMKIDVSAYTCAEFVWTALVYAGIAEGRNNRVPSAEGLMKLVPGQITLIHDTRDPKIK